MPDMENSKLLAIREVQYSLYPHPKNYFSVVVDDQSSEPEAYVYYKVHINNIAVAEAYFKEDYEDTYKLYKDIEREYGTHVWLPEPIPIEKVSYRNFYEMKEDIFRLMLEEAPEPEKPLTWKVIEEEFGSVIFFFLKHILKQGSNNPNYV